MEEKKGARVSGVAAKRGARRVYETRCECGQVKTQCAKQKEIVVAADEDTSGSKEGRVRGAKSGLIRGGSFDDGMRRNKKKKRGRR